MKILIYSFNDKIGDGLQKITFIQQLKKEYPNSYITYTTTHKTSLKNKLNSLVKHCINEFIENNKIESSFLSLFKKNEIFKNKSYDLIIDLQKVVTRTLNLKKIKHKKFFSATADFYFSDYKNFKKLQFKKIYIEKLYFNILATINNKNYIKIPNIELPNDLPTSHLIKKNIEKNIAIAPGAGDQIRVWDFKKYILIGKWLKNLGYNVYFFLGPDEKNLLHECINNGFECPEWKNEKMIANDILFTMSLAKNMKYLLCNDGGTSWIFEFVGVKTLKIFGVTNERKFARPGYSQTIQIKDYGFKLIKDFPIETYKNILKDFLRLN